MEQVVSFSSISMRTVAVTTLLYLSTMITSCGTQQMRTSPELIPFLSAEVIEIVENAERVESFDLRKPDATNAVPFSETKGVSGPQLNEDQRRSITGVLLKAESYILGSNKRCKMAPTYGLRYIQGSRQVDIELDLRACPRVAYFYKGKVEILDLDPAAPELEKRFQSLLVK